MLDAVFGPDNIIAEVIWRYGTPSGGRAGGKKPVNCHDTIFAYSKKYGAHTYNRQFTPYSDNYVNNWFRHTDEDGRKYQTRPRKGKVVRQYLDESLGVPLSTVWGDIMQLYGSAGWFTKMGNDERTGYPTQKPQALARRIIAVSSNPGDLVLDCFAGCAYVPIAAELTSRRWLACDMSPRAWTMVRRQFHKQPNLRIVTEGEYTDPDGLQADLGDERIIRVRGPGELLDRTTDGEQQPLGIWDKPPIRFRQRPLENNEQIWDAFVEEWGTACWYCGTVKDPNGWELQLDHIIPNEKDGSNDDCWNRTLACAPCNGDKSNCLTVAETMQRALEAGRIATQRLLGEQEIKFQRRHQWAQERWARIKPAKLF